MLKNSFIGSTTVMVMGALGAIGAIVHSSTWLDVENVVAGSMAIIGASAYRSGKQRRLKLKADTSIRRGAEIGLIILVFMPAPIQTSMGIDFATRPWSNLIIPIWTLVAYVWVRSRKLEQPLPSIK